MTRTITFKQLYGFFFLCCANSLCASFLPFRFGDNWILNGTSLNSKSSVVNGASVRIRRSLACRYELDDMNTHNWLGECPNRTNKYYFSHSRFTVFFSLCCVKYVHRDQSNAIHTITMQYARDKKKKEEKSSSLSFTMRCKEISRILESAWFLVSVSLGIFFLFFFCQRFSLFFFFLFFFLFSSLPFLSLPQSEQNLFTRIAFVPNLCTQTRMRSFAHRMLSWCNRKVQKTFT